MELNAYTRDIASILSQKSAYRVPRFQREYSWTAEEVVELWDDIKSCVEWDDKQKKWINKEYFVGTLVLVDSHSGDYFDIVDGQQRLTTLTIMLSAIAERLKSLNEKNLFYSIYNNYIEGVDDEGEKYFKLQLPDEQNGTFFKKCIQYENKEKLSPENDAGERLMRAYNTIFEKTNTELLDAFKCKESEHVNLLKAIRDQLSKYLKVIFIAVKEEDEAYTIFETLNARGLSLGSVDLIKNTIFKDMQRNHPSDDAKLRWAELRKIIESANSNASFEDFMRHWWISKYSYVSSDNLYKAFKTEWGKKENSSSDFLEDMKKDIVLYKKIIDPRQDDFKNKDEKIIFRSLSALKIFTVVQPYPFILSVLRSYYYDKKISIKDVKDSLSFLEKFNFKFIAVCKKRSSGIEGSYSSYARKLYNSSKNSARSVLNEFKMQLISKLPTEQEFITAFKGLEFTNTNAQRKKIIQYVFYTIEYVESGKELFPENMTLEHILPQSTRSESVIGIGCIGNLIPISSTLNEKAGSKPIEEKIKIYKESSFFITRDFCSTWEGSDCWDIPKIESRAEKLALDCYNKYWAIV